MKLSLLVFLCLFSFASFSGKSEAADLISIRTKSTAMVFSEDPAQRLTQYYFGSSANAPTSYDPSQDKQNMVYPGANSIFFDQPAIRLTHFDGNTSLDLALVGHETIQIRPGVQLLKLHLKDSYYPAYVTLCIRAYFDLDLFEEWAEFMHQEPSAITLYDLASGTIERNDTSYVLRHYTLDSKFDSNIGPLITLYSAGSENLPLYFLSLNGSISSGNGPVVGLFLSDAQPSNVYLENKISGAQFFPGDNGPRLRLLVEQALAPRIIPASQTVSTQHVLFSYSEQGIAGAKQNLRQWTKENGVNGVVGSLFQQQD
jgi:alpha-galactosidase